MIVVRVALGVVLLAGCGHKASSSNTVPNALPDPGGHGADPNDKTPPVTGPTESGGGADPIAGITPEKACERMTALRGAGCEWANRFPPEMADADVCLRSMTQWFAPETEGHAELQKIAGCWAQDCEG